MKSDFKTRGFLLWSAEYYSRHRFSSHVYTETRDETKPGSWRRLPATSSRYHQPRSPCLVQVSDVRSTSVNTAAPPAKRGISVVLKTARLLLKFRHTKAWPWLFLRWAQVSLSLQQRKQNVRNNWRYLGKGGWSEYVRVQIKIWSDLLLSQILSVETKTGICSGRN